MWSGLANHHVTWHFAISPSTCLHCVCTIGYSLDLAPALLVVTSTMRFCAATSSSLRRSITYPQATWRLTFVVASAAGLMPWIASKCLAASNETCSDDASRSSTRRADALIDPLAIDSRMRLSINTLVLGFLKASDKYVSFIPTRSAAAFCVLHSPVSNSRTTSANRFDIRGSRGGFGSVVVNSRWSLVSSVMSWFLGVSGATASVAVGRALPSHSGWDRLRARLGAPLVRHACKGQWRGVLRHALP
jgi:hypothetical protein